MDNCASASGGLNLSVDLNELVLQLKAQQKSIVDKSKELRNLRQTMLYQPHDQYLFEPPAFDMAPPAPDSSSKDCEKNVQAETADPLQSTLGKNGDKKSYIERLDKFLQDHLLNLNIYGQIKTICPSEFFLCNMLEKDQKHKS